MSGSGNDFVFPDGPSAGWTPARVRMWCDRRDGVGADGLVLLTPGSEFGDVGMTFFNCDGSSAPMCGNAALCATRLAIMRRLAPPERVRLRFAAGTVIGRCPGSADAAEIDLEPFQPPAAVSGLTLKAGERAMALVRVGVPHLVVLVDDAFAVDVPIRGRELRRHPRLDPEGANVQFVAPPNGGEEWLLRTYERGVEGETFACATGCVAAAAFLAANGPFRSLFRMTSGKRIEVAGEQADGWIRGVRVRGEGRVVYRGVWSEANPGERERHECR